MYEMLSGERAFAAESAPDAIASVLRDDPDWSRLPSSVPATMIETIRHCLHKEPDRRPRRIEEIRKQLEALAPET